MTYVSFPGIFGDKVFSINPVAFPNPDKYPDAAIQIRWYGLIICVGIILAVLNTIRCAKKEQISADTVLDYAIWAIPSGIIGARLYFVLTSLSKYSSLGEAIAIWEGGLAIYGGVIGGALAVIGVSLYKKIKFTKIADAIATSILVGQLIGRWGNFCNGEAYGSLKGIDLLGKFIPTPNFADNYFLRMTVTSTASGGQEVIVHPTFLYESLWNLLGFLLITFFVYRFKKFDGQIILSYLIWYGFGRFFIEGLREDSLYLGNTGIRISQLLALLTFIFGVTATFIMLRKAKKVKLDSGEYTNQFIIPENTIGIIPGTQENDNSEKNTNDITTEENPSSEQKNKTTSED